MTQSDNPAPDHPTPDYEALRATRPDDGDDPQDQPATGQGPATSAENTVDEALGGAGTGGSDG